MHLDPHYQVVLLIEAKADVNQARTSDGATPGNLAAQNGHTAIVDALHLASQQALAHEVEHSRHHCPLLFLRRRRR
jgi:ankyrin repeat protein